MHIGTLSELRITSIPLMLRTVSDCLVEVLTRGLVLIPQSKVPSAFQVRTDLPFIETAERHKFIDLIEHLLRHALSVYGAVIKPTQPSWPLASNVVVTLPSGIPKSAEMTVIDILDNVIRDVMPKVIGPTTVSYPRKPDVRLFEDDLWRNLDTAFQVSFRRLYRFSGCNCVSHRTRMYSWL